MLEINRKPQVSVLGIGVPNFVALVTLTLALYGVWNSNAISQRETAREQERTENRLEAIEKGRELSRLEYDKKINPLLDANLPYRLTFLEAATEKNYAALSLRQDRFADAISEVRSLMSEMYTEIKLIRQDLREPEDKAVRKSEMTLGPPRELR